MNREVIATGITVDEAIEAACEKLGAPRESVDIEVLEMPKKKFFGLKTVPAKVKAVLQSEYADKFIPTKTTSVYPFSDNFVTSFSKSLKLLDLTLPLA